MIVYRKHERIFLPFGCNASCIIKIKIHIINKLNEQLENTKDQKYICSIYGGAYVQTCA